MPVKRSYLIGGTFNATPPVMVDGDEGPFQLDSAGNLKVTFTGGSASNPAASPTGSAVPASASYNGVNVGGILTGQTGFSLNAGASIPAAVAIVDGSGNQITSFGGGSQFAMGSAQAANAQGTIALGYDGTNVRGLLTSNTGQLHTIIDSATLGTVTVAGTVAANQGTPNTLANAWPVEVTDGTNVLGTAANPLRVDPTGTTAQPVSGSVSVSNFPATQNIAGVTTDGTTAETNFLVVGGESNDATAQYQPIPLGAGGRSVIVEGVSAIMTAVTGNPVFVGGEDGAGNLQALPIATINTAAPARVVSVGGQDAISGKAVVLAFTGGAAATSFISAAPFLISNTGNICFAATPTGVGGASAVAPYVYSQAYTAWSRLADAGVTGTVGIGGAAASGTAKGGNPVQIGGVFNTPQPTVTTGQIVEVQSTARGALIVATGVDPFVVTDSAAESSLSTIVAQTSFNAQILDTLDAVLRHLELLNKNIASTIPGADSTPEGIDIGV